MVERSFPEGWPEASGGMSALRVQLLFLVAIVLSACASSTDPEGAEYSYFLELPNGPGPHPAVLFMPACSGDFVAREVLESNHARHLREKGSATIMIDPVSRRGIRDGEREICQDMSKAWSHYYKRVGDIKHFVENELPGITEVDQERLGLFGQSGGGISSFHYANAFIRGA